MPNLQEYMTIREAAEFLGVTPNTLRNWGAANKINEYRHPINNYRLYREDELSAILEQLEESGGGRLSSHRPKKRVRAK